MLDEPQRVQCNKNCYSNSLERFVRAPRLYSRLSTQLSLTCHSGLPDTLMRCVPFVLRYSRLTV